jgi:hypothetical protein
MGGMISNHFEALILLLQDKFRSQRLERGVAERGNGGCTGVRDDHGWDG